MKTDRIINKDCTTGMRDLPAESIDLVFADPPFNINYEYDSYKDNLQSDEYLLWSESWMRETHRILRPNGSFWLAIGDDYAAELKVLATKNIGFIMRSWVIWYYTFGVHCTKKFTRSHTHLFHFVKHKENFTFNADAIRVPSARQLVYADKRANPKGRVPDDTWILRPQDIPEAFQEHESVCHFPRVCGTFKERDGRHGCQMPEQLLGRIIRVSSNPNEIVLDPFLGSGSTLKTAKKLDRRYIGFDISPDYCENAAAALAKIQSGDPLHGK